MLDPCQNRGTRVSVARLVTGGEAVKKHFTYGWVTIKRCDWMDSSTYLGDGGGRS